jgi:hypothetical protein
MNSNPKSNTVKVALERRETQIIVFVSYNGDAIHFYISNAASIAAMVDTMQLLFNSDSSEILGMLLSEKDFIDTELRRLEKHLKLGNLTINEYIANTIDAIDRAAAKAIEDSYEEVPPIGPDPEVIMSFPASP